MDGEQIDGGFFFAPALTAEVIADLHEQWERLNHGPRRTMFILPNGMHIVHPPPPPQWTEPEPDQPHIVTGGDS